MDGEAEARNRKRERIEIGRKVIEMELGGDRDDRRYGGD